MKCATVMCPVDCYVNGEPHKFCADCLTLFKASSEGQRTYPAAMSDFRDRIWKERCIEDERKKREALMKASAVNIQILAQ